MKKYVPDILIQLGIWIYTYAILFPITNAVGRMELKGYCNYSNWYKFIAIILVTLGVNVIIRKYLSHKIKK